MITNLRVIVIYLCKFRIPMDFTKDGDYGIIIKLERYLRKKTGESPVRRFA